MKTIFSLITLFPFIGFAADNYYKDISNPYITSQVNIEDSLSTYDASNLFQITEEDICSLVDSNIIGYSVNDTMIIVSIQELEQWLMDYPNSRASFELYFEEINKISK